jgi:hypothetical protein
LWTWAIADYEVEVFTSLLTDGSISAGRLVIDHSAARRNRGLILDWEARCGCGSVRVCMNHAKIARVWSAERRVLARGSCNLNFNARFENVDLSEGGVEFDLVERIEDELPILSITGHSHAEAQSASRLGEAFSPETLEIFRGLPTWKP